MWRNILTFDEEKGRQSTSLDCDDERKKELNTSSIGIGKNRGRRGNALEK